MEWSVCRLIWVSAVVRSNAECVGLKTVKNFIVTVFCPVIRCWYKTGDTEVVVGSCTHSNLLMFCKAHETLSSLKLNQFKPDFNFPEPCTLSLIDLHSSWWVYGLGRLWNLVFFAISKWVSEVWLPTKTRYINLVKCPHVMDCHASQVRLVKYFKSIDHWCPCGPASNIW